jgi:hypothetical protein
VLPLSEQVRAAQRELHLRKQVYPGLVRQGKMSADEAEYQIRAMANIVKTLHRLDAEERQLSLFATPA